MHLTPPTAEEYAALASKYAHRFPDKFTVTLVGDRGASVRLPIVLGNPSGSCDPPDDKASPAWSRSVGIATAQIRDTQDAGDALARDCVLWPDPAVLEQLLDRWPGLLARLLAEAKRKIGLSLALLEQPDPGERPPEKIAAALERSERATWRRIAIDGKQVSMAVDPPPAQAWEFFLAEMRKPGAPYWEIARKMVPSVVRAVDGVPSVDDMLSRWPGTACLVIEVVTELVGIAAEVERGGW